MQDFRFDPSREQAGRLALLKTLQANRLGTTKLPPTYAKLKKLREEVENPTKHVVLA